MPNEWRGTVKQNGIEVASVTAPTRDEAERETMHYAMIYAQDGPVSVTIKPRAAQEARDGE